MPKRTKPYLRHASIRPDTEVDYGAYPFSIPAVREIESIEFHSNVTFFVGENGSGKSTVMEGIAVALGFSPEGGTKKVRFQSAGSISSLHDYLRLARGVPKPHDAYFFRPKASSTSQATWMRQATSRAMEASRCTRSRTVSLSWPSF